MSRPKVVWYAGLFTQQNVSELMRCAAETQTFLRGTLQFLALKLNEGLGMKRTTNNTCKNRQELYKIYYKYKYIVLHIRREG